MRDKTLPQVPGKQDNSEALVARCAELQKEVTHLKRSGAKMKMRLEKAMAEIDEELTIAESVQTGLLPRELPEIVNLKTSAVYIPTGRVGGDLYDIVVTPSQKIAILIFDVSGHGVPAALIGAMAKMLFAHYIEKLESPACIFSEVNRQLCHFIRTDHYLTAFLGLLDPIRNVMLYSRAGHVRPMVFRWSSGEVFTLNAKGFFIGHNALLDIAEYEEAEVKLEPNDRVVFYTDGLTEGENRDNELYGPDRLQGVIEQHGRLPLDDLIANVIENQEMFREGVSLRDDFTLLCIQTESPDWLLQDSGFSREEGPSVFLVSNYSDIDNVGSTILRAMDNAGFSDLDIKRSKVCIFEMLMNAIEHGNKHDTHRKVVVLYSVSFDKARISVIDEGDGFDHTTLPDPLAPENLMKDHGRGVFIIRAYMDEVEFNSKGNRILVVKYPGGKKRNGIEDIDTE